MNRLKEALLVAPYLLTTLSSYLPLGPFKKLPCVLEGSARWAYDYLSVRNPQSERPSLKDYIEDSEDIVLEGRRTISSFWATITNTEGINFTQVPSEEAEAHRDSMRSIWWGFEERGTLEEFGKQSQSREIESSKSLKTGGQND